ncbi:MAG: ORF6N domain-containing protein [Elusimicrobiota bacterium]
MQELIPQVIIEQRIFLIRGHKVMIDRDLAEVFGVETKYLNRQVKRNILRFPNEFMFQLDNKERNELVTICHRFVTMKHSSNLPYAFTEEGVAMLSSVLNSERAIQVNVYIMRAFINLRREILTCAGLKRKIEAMEKKYDAQFKVVFDAFKELLESPTNEKRSKIGFDIE